NVKTIKMRNCCMITKYLKNNKFIKNVLILLSGTIVAQIIALILSPIITRLYGPEAFGLMGVFSSLIQILIPVAALTYPVAIVLPKDDRNAKQIINISLILMTIVAAIMLLILLLFKDSIIIFLQVQEIGSYLYLIPVVIIFAGLMQINTQWLIRTNQFNINTKIMVWQSVILNGSKVGIGLIYPFASVLIILSAIADGLRVLLFKIFTRNSAYISVNNNTENLLTLKQTFKKYKDFPLF